MITFTALTIRSDVGGYTLRGVVKDGDLLLQPTPDPELWHPGFDQEARSISLSLGDPEVNGVFELYREVRVVLDSLSRTCGQLDYNKTRFYDSKGNVIMADGISEMDRTLSIASFDQAYWRWRS